MNKVGLIEAEAYSDRIYMVVGNKYYTAYRFSQGNRVMLRAEAAPSSGQKMRSAGLQAAHVLLE